MAISVEQFSRQLAASGLIPETDLAALLATLPAERKADGEQLARELVRQKKLTAYQAQQVYAGKSKHLVLGNYVVLEKLGQGGMGLVFKAEHRRMKRLVALKVLSPAVTKTPEALRRFQREVEAAAKLRHPNIVAADDADEASGTHFLVLEYVEGADLAALVKAQGPLPLAQALNCVLQAARGLEYAHGCGVVHRDIKPANLLLDKRGVIKILDMGLARLDSAGAQQDQLTGTGQIMGTVDFMAPEQAVDTKHADARADIYSLGITLWYLLTGRAMYEGESVVVKLMAHQQQPIPSLASACPEVAEELEAVFAKMVAKTPAARYQSMTEVIAALAPFVGGGSSSSSAMRVMAPETVGPTSDFLRTREPASKSRANSATTANPKAATLPSVEVTTSFQSGEVDTDPHTQQSLASPRSRKAPRETQALASWWRRPFVFVPAILGCVLLLALGTWAVTRPRNQGAVAKAPEPADMPPAPPKNAAPPSVKKPSEQAPEKAPEKPVPSVAANSAGVIELLPLVNVERDALAGAWQLTPNGLATEGGGRGDGERTMRLQLPYSPPDDYDFEIEFTPTGGAFRVMQCFPAAGRPVAFEIDSKPVGAKQWSAGFSRLDGRNIVNSPEAYKYDSPLLTNGTRYHLRLEVRREPAPSMLGSLRAVLDEKELRLWKGDFSRFDRLGEREQLADPSRVGVITFSRAVTFHRISVREISGHGTFAPGVGP